MARLNRNKVFRLQGPQVGALLLLPTMMVMLSGCGSFFQCEGKASCPTTGTGTGTSTVNYAYVANSAKGATYINGYTLASGSLTATTGSPYSLGYSPSAMAVTPANTFLYAASDSDLTGTGLGNIYGYSIGTGGALSILASGSPLLNESVTSIDISPDGKWLFALDKDGLTFEEYTINSTTGILTLGSIYNIAGALGQLVTPVSLKVAPSGDYIVVALGTAGAETFSFTTSTGVVGPTASTITPATSATGINAVAVDSNNYLYCAGTAGLQVFSTTTAGVPTLQKTYTTGKSPRSIVINSASTYVYVGNYTDGTISGYAIGAGGALTPLTSSPYTAPTLVNALARDSTSAYVMAAGYNSTTGIQLFSIGSTGTLTSSASAGSGTDTSIPGAIAVTH